ncbi:MAG TPA: valine--tRNA ligase [Caulobacteraceae bacterium]|jgi:valyl-tRNA synthetase
MLDKTFDPKAVEARLYARWEASGAFAPRAEGEPYCIVIPPPNVTGSLHIGHALNNTLQDILTRFQRMRGRAALWLPGTDHAGIATQMVVERQLAASGANMNRREMGREAFVEKVWEWKAESGGTIVRQLRRLGASCDWSRERFTLDEGLSAAVRKVFVSLYKQDLIYRDKRLVNWDPHFQTAISDLEVEQREVDGHYWHFAYPLADGSSEIVVATTRPETMLGDTAVAVHPDDERYTALVGRMIAHPITGRSIPIVADEYADPEKGSGAVKITPAHDFNDFQVGKRHSLPMINVLDGAARIAQPGQAFTSTARTSVSGRSEFTASYGGAVHIPENLIGMDRFEARKAIVAEMEQLGLLRGIENTRHVVPHGDRSGVVIEPFLTDQWYVDAATLAKPAIAAVEQGRTVFEPRNWEKTYFEWMRNIEPWCVSRQLWWGHRIPAWYAADGEIFVEDSEEAARAAARAHFGRDVELRQDEDVLDTWFSSALWPFSTLGWPEDTEDLRRFYPTTDLVTGFDIIFFWVARMMMMGIHFMGELPFRRVVINGLVRDEKGQKMSKSKGNVIDPLDIVDDLGADPLRFTMAILSGTREIKLSRQRIEGYRNFGTKLWNAARFSQMNGCVRAPGFDPGSAQLTLNRWIRGETVKTTAEVTRALEAAHFAEAAQALYRFVWNVFCDWHLELAKPVLNGADEAAKAETRAMTAWVLDQCLKLLHPVTPFITEELWERLGEQGPAREGMLITSDWPDLPEGWIDAVAEAEIGLVIGAVSEGRSVRSELNVPPSAKPILYVAEAGPEQRRALEANADVIAATLRVGGLAFEPAPHGAVPYVVDGASLALPVAEFIDLAAERARLSKEVSALDGEIARASGKLANPSYVAKAPDAVVEETRAKLVEAQAAKAKLQAALQRLEAAA